MADATERVLQVPVLLWCVLTEDLERRGERCRESGGFILGESVDRVDRAKRFVPYDVLDSQALDTGFIRFASAGYSALWELCRSWDLRVLADVHTHPERWVAQSRLDREHPMMPERGHVAFILPTYAACSRWSLRGVGVHEYLAKGKWREWSDGTVNECDLARIRLAWY